MLSPPWAKSLRYTREQQIKNKNKKNKKKTRTHTLYYPMSFHQFAYRSRKASKVHHPMFDSQDLRHSFWLIHCRWSFCPVTAEFWVVQHAVTGGACGKKALERYNFTSLLLISEATADEGRQLLLAFQIYEKSVP